MSNRKHAHHTVYNISYHLIWIPKYRKKILTEDVKLSLVEYLFEKAQQIDIIIDAYEIMPDHIHLFIKASPNILISFIVKSLKGYTSFKLRKKFKFLKSYKSLWTHSYYCETIGLISESTVKKYISMQNHKK